METDDEDEQDQIYNWICFLTIGIILGWILGGCVGFFISIFTG